MVTSRKPAFERFVAQIHGAAPFQSDNSFIQLRLRSGKAVMGRDLTHHHNFVALCWIKWRMVLGTAYAANQLFILKGLQ